MEYALTLMAWIGMALSLVGAFLVANRCNAGFALFLIADAMLAPVQVYTHTWPQVALLMAYGATNVYALVKAHQTLSSPI